MFRKTQSPCEGDGGLKNLIEKKMLEKQLSPHLRKKMGIGSPVFLYFFIHTQGPQPKSIGPARQQPRDWALF